MWKRFTERARKAIFDASREAESRGENEVSPEHVLLALIRDADSMAARVLARLGADDGRILAEVEDLIPREKNEPTRRDAALARRAERVIDLAYEGAKRLKNNYIGTEHLLGVVREGGGPAGSVLAGHGVDRERGRREVIALQSGDEQS